MGDASALAYNFRSTSFIGAVRSKRPLPFRNQEIFILRRPASTEEATFFALAPYTGRFNYDRFKDYSRGVVPNIATGRPLPEG